MPLEYSESKVLITLLKYGDLPIMDIPEKSDLNNDTARRAVLKLLEKKLVVEEREKVFPRRRWIRLTPQAKQIAEKLLEIEQILGG
jgi:DNA-binding MarR family transcriptional regulator